MCTIFCDFIILFYNILPKLDYLSNLLINFVNRYCNCGIHML